MPPPSHEAGSARLTDDCLPQARALLQQLAGCGVLATHLLPRCSPAGMVSVSLTCRLLRKLVAEQPESVWQAAAGFHTHLPILHPLRSASTVRTGALQQQRLAASLTQPAGWIEGSFSDLDSRPWAVSRDLTLVAMGGYLHGGTPLVCVLDRALHNVFAALQLPRQCHVRDTAFSWDGGAVATLYYVHQFSAQPPTCTHAVALRTIASGTQATVELLALPGDPTHHVHMVWAPSAAVLGVTVYHQGAARLRLIDTAGSVLRKHPVACAAGNQWALDSKAYISCAAHGIDCIDLASGERHARRRQGARPPRWAWVPCTPGASQRLLLSEDYEMQLLTTPRLLKTHRQQVPFIAYSCSCSHDGAAFQEGGLANKLWVFGIKPEAAVDGPFMQALCTLAHPSAASRPIFSPAGSHFLRVMPEQVDNTGHVRVVIPARLEVFSVEKQVVIASRPIAFATWGGEGSLRWSADGCALYVRTNAGSLHRMMHF